MNKSSVKFSILAQPNENLMLRATHRPSILAYRWMIAPLMLLVIQSWALPSTSEQSSYFDSATTSTLANITSTWSDTTYRPAPVYERSQEFTSKGVERTAADFQNYYLQVIAARNYAAINDELTFYKTFIDTYLGERPDNTPYKIFIGPFATRADARIYKRNNPDLVPMDAYPCPAHTVEPVITKRFLRD